MQRPIMTLNEVVRAMRVAGFRTSEKVIADGIADGRYPFGAMISVGGTGRRRFEIYRADFGKWLDEKTAKSR